MLEAFPNGIPKKGNNNLTDDEMESKKLHDKLIPGVKILLNTSQNSSLDNLDNEIVYVIDKKDNGLWVVKPGTNINEDKFYFLFYNKKDIPTFAGINDVKILESTVNETFQTYIEKTYNSYNNDDSLMTHINYQGKIYKIDPNKKVVFPLEDEDLIYDPSNDSLMNKSGKVVNNNNRNEKKSNLSPAEQKLVDLKNNLTIIIAIIIAILMI